MNRLVSDALVDSMGSKVVRCRRLGCGCAGRGGGDSEARRGCVVGMERQAHDADVDAGQLRTRSTMSATADFETRGVGTESCEGPGMQ